MDTFCSNEFIFQYIICLNNFTVCETTNRVPIFLLPDIAELMDMIFVVSVLSPFGLCGPSRVFETLQTSLNESTMRHVIKFSTERTTAFDMSLSSGIPKYNEHSQEMTISIKEYMMSLPIYNVVYFFANYFVYITSIPGLITNPLTIYLSAKIRPQTTCELYMMFLGITDLMVVVMRITHRFTYQWFPNVVTGPWCKIIYFLTNLNYIYSNWIVVSWTIERCIAVVFPLKLNIWCNVKRIKFFLFILFVVCILFSIPYITEMNSEVKLSGRRACTWSQFYHAYYTFVETIWYMYLPIFVVMVGNGIIIYKLNTLAVNRTSILSSTGNSARRTKEQHNTTRLLITVACIFLVLHIPQLIMKLFQAFNPDHIATLESNMQDFLTFYLLIEISYQTTDFQNSINFFLYCVFGSKVRKVLLHAICCRERQNKKNDTAQLRNISSMLD